MFEIFKKRKVDDRENEKLKEEVNELTKLKKSILELRKLYDEIEEEIIKEKIKKIIKISDNIYKEVLTNSDKIDKIYNYNKYYIPTLIKVTKQYIELKQNRIKTSDAEKLFIKIEDFISKLEIGFDKLYQSLFDNQILDIDAEIRVIIKEMKI